MLLWKKVKENGKSLLVAIFDEDNTETSAIGRGIAGLFKYGKCQKFAEELYEDVVKMRANDDDVDEIMKTLNKALANAEFECRNCPLSPMIGMIYGIRAIMFYEMNEYWLCVVNNDLAKKYQFPTEMASLLNKQRKSALRFLREQRPKIVDEVKLSFAADANLPCLAQGLEIKQTMEYGKHIVTTRNLNVGQTVIVEEAFGSAADTDQNYVRCCNCFESVASLIPCKHCSAAMFCSAKCYNEGHEKFHLFECCKPSTSMEWSSVRRIVLRTIIAAIKLFPNVKELVKVVNGFNKGTMTDHDDPMVRAYIEFLGLHRHMFDTDEEQEKQFVEDTQAIHAEITSNFIYAPSFETLEMRRFLAHLILHHVYVVAENGIALFDLTDGVFDVSMTYDCCSGSLYAHAIYLHGSYLNHSCQPNVARVFVGTKLVVKVIRPIQPGEQLFVNYL